MFISKFEAVFKLMNAEIKLCKQYQEWEEESCNYSSAERYASQAKEYMDLMAEMKRMDIAMALIPKIKHDDKRGRL